jgi:plasmid stabilization system protein ParE
MVPEYETQEIREVIERPYRVIYKATAGRIDVLAVVHGTRMLPPEL